jgi:hypothetical protein
MEQYISAILSSLLSYYLPIPDTGTRVALGMALANFLSFIFVKITKVITGVGSIKNYFWRENYVIIEGKSPTYEKLIEYLYSNYMNNVLGCTLKSNFGKNKLIIEKLSKRDIIDKFEYKGKTHIVKIKFNDLTSGSTDSSNNIQINTNNSNDKITYNKNIQVLSSSSTKVLEKYINYIIKKCNEKVSNDILIFKLSVSDKKNRVINWVEYSTRTSKNIKNTIVSNDVQTNFYDDIAQFIKSERAYAEKGLPFKRGYILHGDPGCGKTSLIKAIANEYQLPIFILDLNMFKTNDELIKAVSEINMLVASNEKYLLIMEDVDRTSVFKKRGRYYYYDDDSRGRITDDCLLNILDGVDENHGRITIMTANDYESLTEMKALIRPGRIDMVVNITECTTDQIKRIVDFHMLKDNDDTIDETAIDEEVKITPAKLIQLILLINNYNNIIKVLNHYKNFNDIDMEQFIKIKDHIKSKDKNTDEDVTEAEDNIDKDMIDLDVKKSDKDNSKNGVDEDKDWALTWRERKIEKDLKKLKSYDMEIKDMEDDLDNRQEKDKLNLEKKKIIKRLLEISVKEKQATLNTFHSKKKIDIKKNDLGLDYLENKDAKIKKDKSEMSYGEKLLKEALEEDTKLEESKDNTDIKQSASGKIDNSETICV